MSKVARTSILVEKQLRPERSERPSTGLTMSQEKKYVRLARVTPLLDEMYGSEIGRRHANGPAARRSRPAHHPGEILRELSTRNVKV